MAKYWQRHLLSTNEASSAKIGLYLIELLTKGISWDSLNNIGYWQDNRLFSANWQDGTIAGDDTYIIHWPWRSQTEVYTEHSSLNLVSLV